MHPSWRLEVVFVVQIGSFTGSQLAMILVISANFWSIFGARGVPGHPMASFCATPRPQDLPKQDLDDILGVPWGPFGTLVGPMFGCGRAVETFGDDCSCCFVSFGRLPVSTSIGER